MFVVLVSLFGFVCAATCALFMWFDMVLRRCFDACAVLNASVGCWLGLLVGCVVWFCRFLVTVGGSLAVIVLCLRALWCVDC